MANERDDIVKQTFRYYYEDGLVEIAVGLLFTVIGLDIWLITSLPDGSSILLAAWLLLPLLTIGGIYGVKRMVTHYKETLVYPRTGYVAYQQKPNSSRWLVIAVALILAAAVLLLPYEWLNQISVLAGAIMFVVLASIGAQVALLRLQLIGGLALIAGLLMAYLPLEENEGLAITFAAMGLALLVSGGLALGRYLSTHPDQGQEVDIDG